MTIPKNVKPGTQFGPTPDHPKGKPRSAKDEFSEEREYEHVNAERQRNIYQGIEYIRGY